MLEYELSHYHLFVRSLCQKLAFLLPALSCSEMIKFLICIVICRLEQHLLCLFSQLVLLIQLNAIHQVLCIGLLCANLTILNRLLLGLVSRLEVYLCLQVAGGVESTEAFSL